MHDGWPNSHPYPAGVLEGVTLVGQCQLEVKETMELLLGTEWTFDDAVGAQAIQAVSIDYFDARLLSLCVSGTWTMEMMEN